MTSVVVGSSSSGAGSRWLGAAGPAGAGASMAVASMVCIQVGAAASTGFFDQIGAQGAAWLRLSWAGVLVLVLVRPRPWRLRRSALWSCLVLGVVTAAMTMSFMSAVARLPLGTAVALEYLGPLLLGITRSRGRGRVWAVPAVVGVLLLTQPWHGGADLVGVGFAVAAGAGWAAYILLTQRVGDEVTGLQGVAVSLPVAALVATGVNVVGGVSVVGGGSAIGRLTWPVVFAGLGLALLMPLVPFVLELLALRRLTAGAFGTLMCLEPAIAVVVGLVALGQVPGSAPIVGVALVITAGVGATRSGARVGDPVVGDPVVGAPVPQGRVASGGAAQGA